MTDAGPVQPQTASVGAVGSPPAPVRPCAVIPVYNHASTLLAVARAARRYLPVIVVDDGSTDGAGALLATAPEIEAVILPANRGKGAALRAGFARAIERGFTHAITLDADGQHDADDIPRFVAACRERPDTFWIGARDLKVAGAPRERRLTNRFSNFWFWTETGRRLPDTQTGFRCYPLEMICRLDVRAERYAYELEMLVRADWAGVPVEPVPVRVDYIRDSSRRSHFRPIVDFFRISRLNMNLVLQTFFLPRPLRALLARREMEGTPFRRRLGTMLRLAFTEHTGMPSQLAGAVGLGLFCGIAPIWGFQMLAAAILAHVLRLNKAIALTASNISFPLLIPFIVFGSLFLGHLVLTGETLQVSWGDIRSLTPKQALRLLGEYLGEYLVGSLLLAVGAAALGAAAAYGIASWFARRRPTGKPHGEFNHENHDEL